jgi:hypothetical protein
MIDAALPELVAIQAARASPATRTTPLPLPAFGEAQVTRGPAPADAAKLEADAETALRESDLPRARKLLATLLALPANEHTPRAQELLGMVLEHGGQTVDAQSAYQAYLAAYSDDEGAPRVRQRLAALNASKMSSRPQPAHVPGRASVAPFMIHGLIAQTYLHDVSRSVFREAVPVTESTGFDRRVNVDELLSSAAITASGRIGSLKIEAKADASHVAEYRPVVLVGASRNQGSYDFIDRLQVDLADDRSGASARIGRQTTYAAGPFGRFDGLTLGVPLKARWTVDLAVGHPVWSSRQTGIDASRTFTMIGATTHSADDSKQLRFSWFDQRSAGLVDRQAINVQASLRRTRFNAVIMLDYDVLFCTLGTAYLSVNWHHDDGSDLSLSAQQVHYPELSTWNAVLGQPIPTLDAMRQLLSLDQLRQAARDRTMVSRSTTITYSRPLGPHWEAIADATLARTSGSPASFDVPEFPAAGTELYAGVQLIGTGLVRPGDTWQLGLRYVALQRTQLMEADASVRLPLGPSFTVVPRLRLARRDTRANAGAQTYASPSLRTVFRLSHRGEFEVEAGSTFIRQTYVTSRLTGDRVEHAFIAHAGYRLRF